ncbi:hypothetical protein Aperf_G00000052002 [Anoplocephala perfoliata]
MTPKKDQSDKPGVHKMRVAVDTSRTFRPYSELKEDFEKLLKSFKSESAVLDRLFSEFENSKNDEETTAILEEMVDLLRKYDNANDFTNSGKLFALTDRLQTASSNVKVGILSCLVSALQSNPPVKIAMHKAGLLNRLVQLWHQELLLPNADSSVVGHCLLATSAFIRHFPYAQKILFGPRADNDIPVGFILLKRTLEFGSGNAKITTRLFSLLGDLLEEQNYTGTDRDAEKSHQYGLVRLNESIPKYGFCQAALRSLLEPNIVENNSYRQRMMKAVMLIANVCDQQQLYPDDGKTNREEIKRHFDQWRKEFTRECKKEDESDSDIDYYAEMLQLLDDLRHSLLRFPMN